MKVGNLPEKKVKVMATDPSILAWRIPWTEEPGGLYSPWGCKQLDTTECYHSLTHSMMVKIFRGLERRMDAQVRS